MENRRIYALMSLVVSCYLGYYLESIILGCSIFWTLILLGILKTVK